MKYEGESGSESSDGVWTEKIQQGPEAIISCHRRIPRKRFSDGFAVASSYHY